MRYAYYAKLKARQQATYRRSDEIAVLRVPPGPSLQPLAAALEAALAAEERAAIERAAQTLATVLLERFGAAPVRVKVLSRRPSTSLSELHGLYEPGEPRALAVIKVWMKTSQHKRVVAFRTFLRTLLHELCHHLDYELLKLDDSFHTAGFFKRESSLFKQLVTVDA
ncbi:MAG TPA: hypothetical protein VFJ95_10625 [Gammaproteobacteria bacterium]|nr:hypothetical protein [Gammaproteobacteria bacterium]